MKIDSVSQQSNGYATARLKCGRCGYVEYKIIKEGHKVNINCFFCDGSGIVTEKSLGSL